MRQYHMPIQDRKINTETLILNFRTSFKICQTSTKKKKKELKKPTTDSKKQSNSLACLNIFQHTKYCFKLSNTEFEGKKKTLITMLPFLYRSRDQEEDDQVGYAFQNASSTVLERIYRNP